MSTTINNIPEFLDTVVNNKSGVSGTVDASYSINGIDYIDVLVGTNMHYKMLRSNWKVVTKYIE